MVFKTKISFILPAILFSILGGLAILLSGHGPLIPGMLIFSGISFSLAYLMVKKTIEITQEELIVQAPYNFFKKNILRIPLSNISSLKYSALGRHHRFFLEYKDGEEIKKYDFGTNYISTKELKSVLDILGKQGIVVQSNGQIIG